MFKAALSFTGSKPLGYKLKDESDCAEAICIQQLRSPQAKKNKEIILSLLQVSELGSDDYTANRRLLLLF